ncbi:MAG TPA: DoxX family protein [Deltaproteobacteria bacterium]|nr:MAG: DoxX family protein [Deltaproteobacteria bacterium GWA2_45_12]HBF13679.1 DoxX family protein [Deltaproteobacteria bacterium]
MKEKIKKYHESFIKITSLFQHPLLFIVRLYWGWQFLITGWGKLHNIEKVTEFFIELKIPLPELNAYFVGGLEFVGGALLLVGLAARIIALPLTVNMIVAYLTADREAVLQIFSNQEPFFAAAPFLFLYASLLVLAFGPGCFSLDALLKLQCKKCEKGLPQ